MFCLNVLQLKKMQRHPLYLSHTDTLNHCDITAGIGKQSLITQPKPHHKIPQSVSDLKSISPPHHFHCPHSHAHRAQHELCFSSHMKRTTECEFLSLFYRSFKQSFYYSVTAVYSLTVRLFALFCPSFTLSFTSESQGCSFKIPCCIFTVRFLAKKKIIWKKEEELGQNREYLLIHAWPVLRYNHLLTWCYF